MKHLSLVTILLGCAPSPDKPATYDEVSNSFVYENKVQTFLKVTKGACSQDEYQYLDPSESGLRICLSKNEDLWHAVAEYVVVHGFHEK